MKSVMAASSIMTPTAIVKNMRSIAKSFRCVLIC
jgi:hypothetical protein